MTEQQGFGEQVSDSPRDDLIQKHSASVGVRRKLQRQGQPSTDADE